MFSSKIYFKFYSQVSQEDNLPKKICDACLYKVDLLYQFWNTTVNAEKQLIQWLGEIGVDVNVKNGPPVVQMSHAHPHSMQSEIILKEESHEIPETPNETPQGFGQAHYGYNQQFMQGAGQAGDASSSQSTSTVSPVSIIMKYTKNPSLN